VGPVLSVVNVRGSKADFRKPASNSIMAPLQLIDRPAGLNANPRNHSGLGAAVSAASHLLLAGALILIVRSGSVQHIAYTSLTSSPLRLVWDPNTGDGGGHDGGGDRATTPARRAVSRGSDAMSAPATAEPSTSAVADMPLEPLSISARPMADAHQTLPGSIASETPGDTGRNIGGGGDGDGTPRGKGTGPNGFGDAAKAGSPGVTTPIVIQQVKPQYTADAMRAKVQGSVWLECIVLPDGTVGDVRITRSLDSRFGLDQEAIAAARRWRFKPGLLDGRPVPVAVTIELMFSLR
jgi:protein TonB